MAGFSKGVITPVVGVVLALLMVSCSKSPLPEAGAEPSALPTESTPATSSAPIETPIPLETPSSAASAGTEAGSSTALASLSALRVAAEEPRAGYQRNLFKLWIDADHDGCDTRREVLIQESLQPVSVGSGCSLGGGKWFSNYDGVTTTDASTFDIDHLVPLAEAWDSGADHWSPEQRESYANDLGYAGTLIAVSAHSNRQKSDADPAGWMPPRTAYDCTYAATWIAVKTRWRLTVDPAEVSALRSTLSGCAGTATVPGGAPAPAPTSAPTAAPAQAGNCAPSYPDFCIPPPPPDLNCKDVGRKNFTVRWDVPDPDPHHFDGDHDGKGCES